MASHSLTSANTFLLFVTSFSLGVTDAGRESQTVAPITNSFLVTFLPTNKECCSKMTSVINNDTTVDMDITLNDAPLSVRQLDLYLNQGHGRQQDISHETLVHPSTEIVLPVHARHNDDTFDYDLTSLLASSSPGDLLDDAEMDELINAEGILPSDKPTKEAFSRRIAGKDSLISRDAYRRFSSVIVYVAFPLIIVGFVTNVMALKVFRELSHNVTNMYMTCLTCFDMAYLLFVVSSHVVVIIIRTVWEHSSARHFLQLYVVYKFFILSARQVIIMATAFMSLDRYFVIASPFRMHNSFIFRRPRVLILVAALIILAFNSHKLLKREVRSWQTPNSNNTGFYLAYTQLYRNNHGLLDDLTIASSCLFQYCPLFAMLVANIALMTSLHKASRGTHLAELTSHTTMISPLYDAAHTRSRSVQPRNHLSRADESDSHAAISITKHESAGKAVKVDKQFFHLEAHKCVTVVAYSLLFFLLALPLALLPILKKVFPEFNVFKSQHYFFLIYVRIFPLLDIISASINFFVFFIKGGAFRSAVWRILRRRVYRQKRESYGKGSERVGNPATDVPATEQHTQSLSIELKESVRLIER